MTSKKIIHKCVMMAGFIVPIQNQGTWQALSFSSIPSNKVEFSQKGLTIKVNKSASPLIYPFKKSQKFRTVNISGTLSGHFTIPKNKIQGSELFDDFQLRLGLVIPGERKLSIFERPFTKKWVKHLFSLAPPNSGISHIHFLNMVEHKKQKGQTRKHPASEFFLEEMAWLTPKSRIFNFSKTFKLPLQVAALWLSIDGDQTKQKYQVHISKIELCENICAKKIP